MEKCKARCPDGITRVVTYTEFDHKGRPYDAGYHQGWIRQRRSKVLGWISWIINGWRFHPYGTDEVAKYAPSVGRKSKFRPWESAEAYNDRNRT